MRRWTEEEKKRLASLYRSGYTYSEIANFLGRNIDSVKGMIKRLRLSTRFKEERQKRTGVLSMKWEEVLSLIQDNQCSVSQENLPRKRGRSLRGYLSDEEALQVVQRYLKYTSNLEGAINLWSTHLQYKRSRLLGKGGDIDRNKIAK